MSKSKHHGGKSGRNDHDDHGAHDKGIKLKGTKGDDVLTGTERNDHLSGGNGNDLLAGLGGNDKLKGGKGDDRLLGGDGNDRLDGDEGDDFLDGGAGNDLLIGGKGNDQLFGGAGNDVLYGDMGGKGKSWGWDDCFWWKPRSEYDDFLDGGAGNDRVFAGRGDDVVLYSMSGNLGAGFADIGTRDSYDGGSGFDTLQLALTYGELQLASVQQDIAAFQAFLARKANPHGDHGKTFEFGSFDLDARNFEALVIQELNTGPTAHSDSGSTNEDTLLVVAAPGVLANDTDPDHLDVLVVTGADVASVHGAVVLVGADGNFSYDPRAALALQQLAQGDTATDSFGYTIADLAGVNSTATVRIEVAGVNDAPVANPDADITDEDHGVVVDVLANDTDVDTHDTHTVDAAVVASGLGTASIVGNQVAYDPGSAYQFLAQGASAGVDIDYTMSDNHGATSSSTVHVTVAGVNDAPDAADDFITAAGGGAVTVAIVYEALSDAITATAGQISNDTWFDFNISAIHFSDADSIDELAQYDVVLLGNSYYESFSAEFWAALHQYVDTAGGGVVSNGWTNYNLDLVNGALGPTANADYDASVPVTGDFLYTYGFGQFVPLAGGHPITDGIPGVQAGNYVTSSLNLDSGAVSLATLFGDDSALAYQDQPGAGRTVYLGFHFTDAIYRDGAMAASIEGDRLLEQALNWAGGGGGGAITEDSTATIAAADLLANDTDPDLSDVLSIDSVSGTSTHGAMVSRDSNGDFIYNATVSATLNALAEGESESDSFTYTVTDGHGGFDTANVEVIVQGRNDAPVANPDAGNADEDHSLVVDVLANDTDVDTHDTHTVDAAVVAGGLGTASIVGNQVAYDPGSAYQYLAQGESAGVDIDYTMSDNHGATSSSTVHVTVAGVNDGPLANADAAFTYEDLVAAIDVLANDTDVDRSDTHTVDSVAIASGFGTASVIDNEVVYDPGSDYQYLAVGESADVAIDYTMSDNHGAASSSSVALTVRGANDGPDAVDDTIGDAGGGGAIRVAVVGGSTSNYANATAWLTDSTVFDIDATAVPIDLSTTKDEWVATLAGFDVVVVGENGTTTFDYNGSQIFAALRDFVDAGGGVVTTGVFAKAISAYTGATTQADADYISPAAPGSDFLYVGSGSPISFDPSVLPHPIAGDITGYAAQGLHEVAEAVDATATVLATDASGRTAIAYDEVMAGRTVFLGSIHMAVNQLPFDPTLTQSGPVDQIFEQAVAWAAGTAGGGASAATDEDTARTINAADLLANDSDPDASNLLTISSVSGLSALGASVSVDAGGNVLYDPVAALQHLASGAIATDSFTYTIEDGFGGSDTATVTLTVAGVNDAPVAEDDVYQLAEGGLLTVDSLSGLLANDDDVDSAALTAVLATGPAHGILTLNPDGSFSYTPAAGFDGADSFTYRASDGALSSDLATVSLAVAALNHAPVANTNSYSMNEDTTLTVSAASGVLANDTDADGDALNAVLVSNPAHGALTFNSDGSFSFTPAANFFGTDSFSYKANDGVADSKAATVSIKIADVSESGGNGKVVVDVLPGAELQYFMRVEGVTKDWVELDSFSLGLSTSVSGGSGDREFGGKVSAEDVFATLGSTQAVAKLVETAGTGAHLKSVEILAYASGGSDDRLVDSFKFEDVLVSALQTSAESSGTANQVGFDYAKFGHTHITYDDKTGKKTGDVDTGYDFKAGKAGGDGGGGPSSIHDLKLDQVASTDADLDYYVHFEGIGGSSEWLQLESFSLGLSNSGSTSVGGGAGAGKTTATDVMLMLGSSKQLVELTTALSKGTHLKSAEIEVYKHGGDQGLLDEFRFEDVLVTSLSSTNASDNALSFDFAKFSHGHVLYDAKTGKETGSVSEGFDFTLNKAFDGPAPTDNVGGGGKVVVDVLPGAELQYFMRVEGVTKDWVELDSFSLGLSTSVSGGSGDREFGGKVSAEDVFATLGSTQAVAKLVETAGTGAHLKSVEILAYASGGSDDRLVDSFKFEDVLVSALQTSAESSGTANQVGFDYAKFGHTHITYDDKTGKKTGDVDTGYDFKAGKAGGDGGGGPSSIHDLKLDQVASTDADLDYYVHFEGIGGSSEWLQLESFSLGLSNSGSTSVGGGAGAGKTTATDVMLMLGSSKQLVELTTALSKGTHLKSAEIEVYKHGGDQGLLDEFRFEDVLVTSLSSTNASDNALSFDFAKFSHGHVLYDAKTGKETSSVSEGFDFTLNKAFDGPAPTDNVGGGGKVVVDVLPGAELQYFMRVEGVTKDWVELDSFSLGLSTSVSGGSGDREFGGKVSAEDVFATLGSTQAVAKLVETAGTGAHLKSVEILAYASGGSDDRLVDSFKFEDVLVSALQTSAESSGTANQVGFDYAKFGHTHITYDDKTGKKTGDVDTGYDFKAGKAGGDGGGGPSSIHDLKLDQVASTDADLDYYVHFEGIGGSSEWLQLESFSLGLSNSGSTSVGGGAGAGKTTATDVMLMLGSSKQLVELTTALSKGTHLKSAEIEVYKHGGDQGLLDEFRFEDVLVTSLSSTNASDNALSFDFAKFSHGHVLYDAKTGKETGSVSEGFDFTLNKAFDGPAPDADIGFF